MAPVRWWLIRKTIKFKVCIHQRSVWSGKERQKVISLINWYFDQIKESIKEFIISKHQKGIKIWKHTHRVTHWPDNMSLSLYQGSAVHQALWLAMRTLCRTFMWSLKSRSTGCSWEDRYETDKNMITQLTMSDRFQEAAGQRVRCIKDKCPGLPEGPRTFSWERLIWAEIGTWIEIVL